MARSWIEIGGALAARQRRRLRESEAAFILLAALTGLAAGLATNIQSIIAHGMQRFLYGVGINRLSALGSIHHPWKLLALPLGGLAMVGLAKLFRSRKRAPIDVVEANALHGGRIPFADNLVIASQTIVSNGAGASVGLEATFAQMGGGIGSSLGQAMQLRRNDLRVLVGAGAGAAVGAAFGAPLTGAFYAFEIVIGTYTPAAIAPVVAAALAATIVTRTLGIEPYLIATTADRAIGTGDYLIFAALGLVCALAGIAIMRLVTGAELAVQKWRRLRGWHPVIGGALLMPIAYASPQALASGHGALHLDLVLHLSMAYLAAIILLKVVAVIISLASGFRGGLFFASLFLGSLVGQLFAELINAGHFGILVDSNDAALVGMAALSVSVVGGPMTLSLLILEATHDFALTGVVLTASLIASAVTREMFGYSFSTWRLHLRGSAVRSPRDIGWMMTLTAGRLMRKDPVIARDTLSIAEFRLLAPLGSTSKVLLADEKGRYRGMVPTAAAWAPDLEPLNPVAGLATLQDIYLAPASDVREILRIFDAEHADDLAVVDETGRVIGAVSEKYVRRRFFEESEEANRALYGERR